MMLRLLLPSTIPSIHASVKPFSSPPRACAKSAFSLNTKLSALLLWGKHGDEGITPKRLIRKGLFSWLRDFAQALVPRRPTLT